MWNRIADLLTRAFGSLVTSSKITVSGYPQTIARIFSEKEKQFLGRSTSRAVGTAEVGYSAHYAGYVHETHPTHKKFLEGPARTYAKQVSDAIEQALKDGKDMNRALLAGAMVLLMRSQPMVPVKTGYLKSSGYVKVV